MATRGQFFVAIGMLIDPHELVPGLPWLALFIGLIVVAKVLVSWPLAARAVPAARPLQVAVGLGQIGEFSFVLASALVASGAIENRIYVALVAAVAVSIAVSAVLVRLVPVPAPAGPPTAAAAG